MGRRGSRRGCAFATYRPLGATLLALLLAAACGGGGSGGGGSRAPGPTGTWSGGRTTLSLNGEWEVGEGGLTDAPPADFPSRIQVPSLITAAEPPFADIGIPSPRRDAFWYRRRFTVPVDAPTALLRLHKASYGATVWLNGQNLGSSTNVYTLAEFDARGAIRPGAENELVVRVGADQTKLPAEVPTGWDFEKHRWYPGLWDDVALVLTGETHVVRVKVEPDLARGIARVLTTVANLAPGSARFDLEQRVRTWRTGDASSPIVRGTESIEAGEERVFAQDVPIRDLRPWTTDDPFLYVVETTIVDAGDPDAVSDRLETRFGMREVEWRGGAEAGFYLNGKRTPLRGSNITLHRFFEDPDAEARPWNELWVRKLLVDYPKELDWNVFRMTIGRAPNLWYDVLDEAGILVADEFAFWGVFEEGPPAVWSEAELEKEFVAWVQESWNHPSIAWWDSSNENTLESVGRVVGRVRQLDPTRQWENGGWQTPLLADDPVEHHPYFFASFPYRPIQRLDEESGAPPAFPGVDPSHPWVANEYAFLWIGPDGLPTPATEAIYQNIVGPKPFDPAEVREAHAYLVGGLTEFLRARRRYAGVQHFVYLSHTSDEGYITSDDFLDHRDLVLEPRWREYARNAFAAIGVYVDSWRKEYPPDEDATIPLVLMNDTNEAQLARVRLLAVLPDGTVASTSALENVLLDPVSSTPLDLTIRTPAAERWVLYAELQPENAKTVWSRRKIGYEHEGVAIPDPPFRLD